MTGPRTWTADIDGYVPFPDDRIEAYLTAGHWRNRPFHAFVDDHAAYRPDAPAVVGPTRTLSYADLAERARQIAAAFLDAGIGRHDRVAVQLPNCVGFLETFFACSRVGAVPVLLLPRHREREVRHLVELTGATAAVTVADAPGSDFDYLGLYDDLFADVDSLDTRYAVGPEGVDTPQGWTDLADLDGEADPSTVDVNPNDPGLMMLSGGTSGLPKAIPRTHNDYAYLWEHIADRMGVRPAWTLVPGVPLPHSFAFGYIMGAAIWAGAAVAVEPRLKPLPLMELIDRVGGDVTALIPKQLIDLLEHDRAGEYDLSTLDVVCSGGQKVPPDVTRRVTDRWGVGFCHVYGMGEGAQIFTAPDDPFEVQANTVGRPLSDGDEIRIEAEDGTLVDQGELGELVVRGPGIFTGYFRNEEANAEDFDDGGWFHTGDVFSRHEDGNYQVWGRLDDTINRAGETIYAPAVEDALVEHPKIKSAGVIGIPDEVLGERVGAFVVLEPGVESLTREEVVAFFKEQGHAVYLRPEVLEVVDELPETTVGKIDRPALRERLAAEGGGASDT